jgi:hypothetical protein
VKERDVRERMRKKERNRERENERECEGINERKKENTENPGFHCDCCLCMGIIDIREYNVCTLEWRVACLPCFGQVVISPATT